MFNENKIILNKKWFCDSVFNFEMIKRSRK